MTRTPRDHADASGLLQDGEANLCRLNQPVSPEGSKQLLMGDALAREVVLEDAPIMDQECDLA